MTTIDRLREMIETADSHPFAPGLGDKFCAHVWVSHDASPVLAEWMREARKAQFMDACPHCGGTVRVGVP